MVLAPFPRYTPKLHLSHSCLHAFAIHIYIHTQQLKQCKQKHYISLFLPLLNTQTNQQHLGFPSLQNNNMISPKKIARMTRKWQNMAALRCKKMAVPRGDCGGCVDKGCFAVYSYDEIRFVVPLDYLKNDIFQELLETAEEEYGSQSSGPIRLPFMATFMQYTVALIESRQMSKDVEEEFRMTITSWRCLSTSNLQLPQIHSMLLVG